MGKFKKLLSILLVCTMIIAPCSLLNGVFAQTDNNSNPLTVNVTTDKSSYTAYGIAEITVKVTNTSDETVNNISAEAVFKQLAPVGKNNETFKEVEALESGESLTFSYKATLDANKVNVGFFEKILLWFVRLFNGGYNATSHNIEANIENITEIKFGKYTAENVVAVEFTEINSDIKTYEELIKNVAIDKKYERNDVNVSVDENSGTTYINNIIMIMFDSDCSNERKAKIINSIKGKVVGGISGYDELHIEIKNSTLEELEEICDSLNKNEDIYATYDKAIYNVSYIPNDSYNPYNQGNFVDWENEFEGSAYNWSTVAVDAPDAWDYNDYYNKINIGVIDNGFSSNKDLKNIRIVSSENSPEAHGTEVTGIIGATANNKTGIAGIVWNKNIYAYDAQKSNSRFMYDSDIYAGVELLVKQGCKVINLSLGVDKKQMTQKEINNAGKNASKKMGKLIEKGFDFVIVQAAGNGDSNGKGMNAINNGNFCSITKDNCYSSKKVTVDDIMSRIIVVASAERNCETKSYSFAVDSNGGNQVDIAAPGVGVLTTTASTEYPYKLSAGTSIAAPFVTSVASLVWSVNNRFTGKEVVEIVLKAAKKGNVVVKNNATSPTTTDIYMVNAKLAVEEAINRACPKFNGLVVESVGSSNNPLANVTVIAQNDNFKTVVKTDANGKFTLRLPFGTYKISLSLDKYTSTPTTITVDENTTNQAPYLFFMKKDNSGGGETGSEKASIHGTIKDSETKEAISNVKVTLRSEDTQDTYTTMTDEIGDFNFEDLTAGRYTLFFEHEDYIINETNSFTLDEGVMFVFTDPFEFTKKDSSDGDEEENPNPDRTVIASGNCGAEGDNVKWVLYDDGELVISGSGEMKDFESEVAPWNSYQNYIKTVEIKKGVTSIGYSAFENCKSLANIDISDSVISIGKSAFRSCTSLIDIVIPEGVTLIESYTFYECDNLARITIPDSVTGIGYLAFYHCKNIVNISLPKNLTIIAQEAFDGCSGLTDIALPGGLTSTGYMSFARCSSLANVTISYGVKAIDDYSFFNCTNLTNIAIPDSVTSIGKYAFNGCKNLAIINIPDSVTSIGASAFKDCSNLTSIEIPEGVTSIERATFSGCSNLASIKIPKSIEKIHFETIDSRYGVFYACDKLVNVYYGGTENDWYQLTKSNGNVKNALENATIHYNS